jgi:hypothetical protein
MQPVFIRRILFGSCVVVAGVAGPWSPGSHLGVTEAVAQGVPSSARPGHRSCSERSSLRSEHSREPTEITFINRSGMYRGLMWIDPQGQFKDYGGLNSGEKKTIKTFRTHPWMITTGPGDCIEIILPAAEPGTATLK